MTIAQTVLGIDVSGAFLDCSVHPAGRFRRVANTPAGIAGLLAWIGELGAFVVLEATAPFDQPLLRALERSGAPFHRANPGRVRDFARAAGLLAKTDRVDARLLALYGASLPLRQTPVSAPERLALQALCARRDQLVEIRKGERTRLKACAPGAVRDSLCELIAVLDELIRRIDTRLAQLIDETPELAQRHGLLRSASGIGPVAAGILLACLPELGQVDRRAIASLAGLAPIAHDSGLSRGKRSVRGGRKRVRDALYMAALSAARTQPWRPVYEALRARGKPAKLALVALARKLLVALNADMRKLMPA
jgi:transposase